MEWNAPDNSGGYATLAAISIAVLVCTAISRTIDRGDFERFFGSAHPVAVMAVVVAAGFALLGFLSQHYDLAVLDGARLGRGLAMAAAIASLFGVAVTLADWAAPWPDDINATFPESLFFYPAIGFFIEVVFHALLLAAALTVATRVLGFSATDRVFWICILVVATAEPTFQVVAEIGQDSPAWRLAFLWFNVFGINVAQLWLFKEGDFVTMYSFRLVYYSWWHVIWGHVRLSLLF